jgi:hypothetical protein
MLVVLNDIVEPFRRYTPSARDVFEEWPHLLRAFRAAE